MNSYYDQSVLHPIGVTAVLLLGLAMMLLPRRYALVPVLILACFISPAQRLVVAGLDFSLLRVMVLFGWARVLLLNETAGFRWKPFDTALVIWAGAGLLISPLREGTGAEVVYRLGLTYDAIGMTLLFRVLVRGWEDIEVFVRAAALVSLPVAAVFVVEQVTGRNMFSIFGGVSLVTEMREGRIRCRGAFAHAIYAGCFWAALVPCIGALWWGARAWRWCAPAGIAAATVIVATTASSTPILALAIALLAWAAYPLRRRMRAIRWSTVALLVALHVVMVAPVWHLIARVNVVGGSTGWYRYKLINGFVNSFETWWFAGSRAYEQIWGDGYRAVTNHYVLEGLEGGLLTLVLFITMIALAFGGVGRARRLAASVQVARFPRVMAWALGVSLFVHCVDFLAISYFGQVLMAFYLTLAMCGSVAPARGVRLLPVRRFRRAARGARARARATAGARAGAGVVSATAAGAGA